jgi:hypothetical protein
MFRNDASMFDQNRKTSAPLVRLGMTGLLIGWLAGCSNEFGAPLPPVHPVRGQVLLPDGKPLATGQVVLVSTADAREYTGNLDADGRFVIKVGDREGAAEGDYKVRIDPEPGTSKGKGKKGAAALSFPARYADETTSELKVTIKPGENDLEPFKLTKSAASPKTND